MDIVLVVWHLHLLLLSCCCCNESGAFSTAFLWGQKSHNALRSQGVGCLFEDSRETVRKKTWMNKCFKSLNYTCIYGLLTVGVVYKVPHQQPQKCSGFLILDSLSSYRLQQQALLRTAELLDVILHNRPIQNESHYRYCRHLLQPQFSKPINAISLT